MVGTERQGVKITADTNVLVRAIVADEPKQAKAAQALLEAAELVAVTPACLCEFVWVLSRGYGIAHSQIADAIRGLINSANVEADRPVIDAGLALLDEGGDFADGVIAHEGAALGGATFATFDKEAARRLTRLGAPALRVG